MARHSCRRAATRCVGPLGGAIHSRSCRCIVCIVSSVRSPGTLSQSGRERCMELLRGAFHGQSYRCLACRFILLVSVSPGTLSQSGSAMQGTFADGLFQLRLVDSASHVLARELTGAWDGESSCRRCVWRGAGEGALMSFMVVVV